MLKLCWRWAGHCAGVYIKYRPWHCCAGMYINPGTGNTVCAPGGVSSLFVRCQKTSLSAKPLLTVGIAAENALQVIRQQP